MQVDLPLKIIGLGRYLPKRIVPNSELETLCGLPAGWVERRNGVRERRWVTDETSSFMSAQAACEALEEAKLKPHQLDLIINRHFCCALDNDPMLGSMVVALQ